MQHPIEYFRNTTRISLIDDVPELGPDDVLEIDIFGSGTARAYESLTVNVGGSDAARTIAAVELLDPLIERLEDLLEQQTSREDLESWAAIILRLRIVEQLLLSTNLPGSTDYAFIVARATNLLLEALRDDAGRSSGLWSTPPESLRVASEGCSRLAAQVEASVFTNDTRLERPTFAPLEAGLMVNNALDLARALRVASRARLDMNTLEVGVVGGGTAAIVRGRVRSGS